PTPPRPAACRASRASPLYERGDRPAGRSRSAVRRPRRGLRDAVGRGGSGRTSGLAGRVRRGAGRRLHPDPRRGRRGGNPDPGGAAVVAPGGPGPASGRGGGGARRRPGGRTDVPGGG